LAKSSSEIRNQIDNCALGRFGFENAEPLTIWAFGKANKANLGINPNFFHFIPEFTHLRRDCRIIEDQRLFKFAVFCRNFYHSSCLCEFRLKPARDSDAKPATIPG